MGNRKKQTRILDIMRQKKEFWVVVITLGGGWRWGWRLFRDLGGIIRRKRRGAALCYSECHGDDMRQGLSHEVGESVRSPHGTNGWMEMGML